jgi:hypothetical protein
VDIPREDVGRAKKRRRRARRRRWSVFEASRITVTTAFLLVSVGMIWIAYSMRFDSGRGTLLLNLGTEIVGTVITVAVVDWFFERRRLQERARQLAWTTQQAIEHAVWVWQGGPRELETDELLGILDAVNPDDPIPEFTQNLLLNLGTRSKQVLHNDAASIRGLHGLREAFEHLVRLNAVREGGAVIPPRKLADILEDGVLGLADLLGLPMEKYPASLIRFRDPAAESQEQRHFGVRTETRDRPGRAPGGPF